MDFNCIFIYSTDVYIICQYTLCMLTVSKLFLFSKIVKFYLEDQRRWTLQFKRSDEWVCFTMWCFFYYYFWSVKSFKHLVQSWKSWMAYDSTFYVPSWYFVRPKLGNFQYFSSIREKLVNNSRKREHFRHSSFWLTRFFFWNLEWNIH